MPSMADFPKWMLQDMAAMGVQLPPGPAAENDDAGPSHPTGSSTTRFGDAADGHAAMHSEVVDGTDMLGILDQDGGGEHHITDGEADVDPEEETTGGDGDDGEGDARIFEEVFETHLEAHDDDGEGSRAAGEDDSERARVHKRPAKHQSDGDAAVHKRPATYQHLEETEAETSGDPSATQGAAKAKPTLKRPAASLDRWLVRVPLGSANSTSAPAAPDEQAPEEEASAEVPADAKIFEPGIERELKEFIESRGYSGQKPVIEHEGSIPKWGRAVAYDGRVEIQMIPRPKFGETASIGLTLRPERIPKRRRRALPKSGLVKTPMKINRFGTIRRYAATHQVSACLTVRGCRDLPNNIFYSTKYRKHMQKLKKARGRFVNPMLGEHIMGMPANWTSAGHTADSPEVEPVPGRLRGASLFSGVAGLELGLASAIESCLYVECDDAAQAVLQRRMQDKQSPSGIMVDDVAKLTDEHLTEVEAVSAGFPCPDIAISGHRTGLQGSRSSLFRHVIKTAVRCTARCLVLENVAHIISDDMRAVFFEILMWLIMIGFNIIKWGVVSASDVGSPQLRKRWFLVACREENDMKRLRGLVPSKSEADIVNMSKEAWNMHNTVKLEDWLLHQLPPAERERLKQLGNAVVPKCAEVALSALVHG